MDKLTPSEKRKLKNAKYYAKKRDEKGKEAKTSYENLKLENKQLTFYFLFLDFLCEI